MADSLTLLSAIAARQDDAAASWRYVTEALGLFSGLDAASGLARALGMAAIIQLWFGDAELETRVAGATEALGRRKGVMVAPARVLHLPDPVALARESVGSPRVEELLAEGGGAPVESIVEEVLAAPAPPEGARPAVPSEGGGGG